jgi:hypothetical protein
MADRCLRCGRPIQSDLDWMERTMPAGACRQTGGVECEEARDERYRRMERVCEAARAAALWVGPERDVLRLRAALRALDGEG